MNMITIYDGDDELEIPGTFELCPKCRGSGTHVNPAIDGNGITGEEMHELGQDFQDDYMAGVYDVPCYECEGKRVLLVADTTRMSPAQVTAWMNHLQADADDRAMVEMELRMGA